MRANYAEWDARLLHVPSSHRPAISELAEADNRTRPGRCRCDIVFETAARGRYVEIGASGSKPVGDCFPKRPEKQLVLGVPSRCLDAKIDAARGRPRFVGTSPAHCPYARLAGRQPQPQFSKIHSA